MFVTRLKKNAKLEALSERPLEEPMSGDGFTVLADREVRLGQGKTQIACQLRCISIRRDNGDVLEIVTNDFQRSPIEIATFYKIR